MNYNATVLRYFDALPGGGPLADGPGTLIRGEAGRREQGIQVLLQAHVAGDRVREARFQAFACPHLLAACARLVEWLNGRTRAEAAAPDWAALLGPLEIPPEKRGRLLVLEDALQNWIIDWDTRGLARHPGGA